MVWTRADNWIRKALVNQDYQDCTASWRVRSCSNNSQNLTEHLYRGKLGLLFRDLTTLDTERCLFKVPAVLVVTWHSFAILPWAAGLVLFCDGLESGTGTSQSALLWKVRVLGSPQGLGSLGVLTGSLLCEQRLSQYMN